MDKEIYYYVWRNKSGKVYGWLATDRPSTSGLAQQVTREEFISLGGNPDSVVLHENLEDTVATLQGELELAEAKINALSGQNDFFEECLVEMAMIVYQ